MDGGAGASGFSAERLKAAHLKRFAARLKRLRKNSLRAQEAHLGR